MFVTYLIYAERQHVHIPAGGKGGMGGGGAVLGYTRFQVAGRDDWRIFLGWKILESIF